MFVKVESTIRKQARFWHRTLAEKSWKKVGLLPPKNKFTDLHLSGYVGRVGVMVTSGGVRIDEINNWRVDLFQDSAVCARGEGPRREQHSSAHPLLGGVCASHFLADHRQGAGFIICGIKKASLGAAHGRCIALAESHKRRKDWAADAVQGVLSGPSEKNQAHHFKKGFPPRTSSWASASQALKQLLVFKKRLS